MVLVGREPGWVAGCERRHSLNLYTTRSVLYVYPGVVRIYILAGFMTYADVP